MGLYYSLHADQRAAQRNVSDDDVEFVLRFGHRMRRTGVIYYALREKDLPSDLPGSDPRRRLVGTTVMLCKCGTTVITVYRNQRAFKRDKRKTKYEMNESIPVCACCTACRQHQIA
jgi:hypothetical protein